MPRNLVENLKGFLSWWKGFDTFFSGSGLKHEVNKLCFRFVCRHWTLIEKFNYTFFNTINTILKHIWFDMFHKGSLSSILEKENSCSCAMKENQIYLKY